MIESDFYKKFKDNKKVQCTLCYQNCIIAEGGKGFCRRHENINGSLFNYNYGRISSVNVDPIEKKPLYHFLPGTKTYSIGGFGCNMGCYNCQNYMISQYYHDKDEGIEILPETILENTINNDCKSISWTYNEPTLYLQFSKETAFFSKENYMEKNIKNIYVSNGYMSDIGLNEILKFVDGFNIDLKSISDYFYRENCKARVEPVLDNLKKIYKSGKHLEITNLIIPKWNDSQDLIKELVEFISNELNNNIPLHFSRFFPHYRLEDYSSTNLETLDLAKKIAIDNGIEYVYLGNVDNNQNSYCSNCGELLFKRNNYLTENMNKIENNKCLECGKDLNFIL